MKKIHYILIVLLGFFLMPSITFACGSHSGKDSCKKELSLKTEKKDCCNNDSHSNSKSQKGCNGKCGHTLCSSTSVNSGIASIFHLKIHDNISNFSNEKQQFYHSVSFTSAGYSSIWLIPKIG